MSVSEWRKLPPAVWVWGWLTALFGVLLALYWPSLSTPYFFDDLNLPFTNGEPGQGFDEPAWWVRRFLSYLSFFWVDQFFF